MRADLWCCVFSLKLKSVCSILGCFMNTCCCFVGVLSIIHHSNCLHCLRRGLALCTPHHDLHLGAMMLECVRVVCRCGLMSIKTIASNLLLHSEASRVVIYNDYLCSLLAAVLPME